MKWLGGIVGILLWVSSAVAGPLPPGTGTCPSGQAVTALVPGGPPRCASVGGSGSLPTPPNAPQILFSNSGAAVWSAAVPGGDLVINAVGQLNLQYGTQTCSTSPCTISSANVICNSASGPITLLLPPAMAGKVEDVNLPTTATNACTLQAQGGDLINGSPTFAIPNAQNEVQLIGNAAGSWGIANVTYPPAQTFAAHNFVTGSTAGKLSAAQPACSDLTGAAAHCGTNASELTSGTLPTAQLPNPLPPANIPAPTASTLGGVNSLAAQSHKFLNSVGTNGLPTAAQPASTDLSDLPIPISSGGTAHSSAGAATANAIGAAALGNNADITQLSAFIGPMTLAQGGTACPSGPTTFASLPAFPTAGEICAVTDPSGCTCQTGTAIVNGGGASCAVCQVTFNGKSNCGNGSQNCWMPAGGAASSGTQVPINQLPSQTAAYNANAQKLQNVACPSLANDVLAQACAASVTTATATTSMTTPFIQTSASNPAASGLVRAANNSTIMAARNSSNNGDVPVSSVDTANNVHFGGVGANGISLDNSSTVSQGTFTTGGYYDAPLTNVSWMGSTDDCTKTVHNYTVVSNGATLSFACPVDGLTHRLKYRFFQPVTGAPNTYNISIGSGAQPYTALGGPLPSPCAINGCYDEYDIVADMVKGVFSVIFEGSFSPLNITPTSACPSGQTCYFFSSSSGNDNTGAGTQASPWASISKAMTKLSSLNPGDELLFKGGDTWTASASNPSFQFGDTATHAVNGTASKPIVIGTYGAGQAIIDATNTNPFCFETIGTPNPVNYLTVSNFECKHAWAQGVTFQTGSVGIIPGLTVQNMYIHDTGQGCATAAGSCVGTDPWPDWTTGAHSGNTPSFEDHIEPTSNNAGNFVYTETVASCSSSGSRPAFSQTPGTATADGTCSWLNTGVAGVYKNQLDFEDVAGNPGGDGTHFLNNTIKWVGGHNCLNVHFDFGAVLVAGNLVGPGCSTHNFIDVKGSGSLTNQAVIKNNVCVGGFSQFGVGGQCFYTENPFNAHSNQLWQGNVAYDTLWPMFICPGGVANGFTGSGVYKVYNNTFYAVNNPGVGNSAGYFANSTCDGTNLGTKNPDTLDVRNNIFDGGASNAFNLVINAGGGPNDYSAGCTEDYNDIGGAQGFVAYSSCGGSTSLSAHDFNATNPNYINASVGNFQLNPNSPVDCPTGGTANGPCAGLNGLTTNNQDMGAY